MIDLVDMAQAHEARDAGMAASLAHAESDSPGWPERALAFLIAYARRNETFTAEQVTAALQADPTFRNGGPEQAIGPIIKRAARLRVIVNTGRVAPRTKGHGSPGIVWRSLVWGTLV